MKIERYIREYAAALMRNKATDETRRRLIETALQHRERGTITAAEAMSILYKAAHNTADRLTIAATFVYYDCEHDELVTLAQLRAEWDGMTEEERDERGGGSFDDFLEACMFRNNGTLIEFSEWIEHRLK